MTEPRTADGLPAGTPTTQPWRLIIHGAADGAWNMAVDEAILASYLATPPPPSPTLRLYGWKPAALSLGRSQDARSSCDPAYLRDQAIDLVRRPTGGLAVLHDRERTYSVIGSLRRDPFPGGVLDTYERIASMLRGALERMGAEALPAGPAAAPATRPRDPAGGPSCFESASVHELAVGGRKLVGSAQLRRRGAFLQHGSILLDSEAERLGGALRSPARRDRFTDLRRVLGRPVGPEEVDRAMVAGCAETFGAELRHGALDAAEADLAARLRCWKYDSVAWTFHGRLGSRERHWGPALTL